MSFIACGTVDPGPDHERARAGIRNVTGEEAVHDPEHPVLSDEEIRAVLAEGLALGEATRLALLNNRRLQAGFLALGVARADYVQAGLLENPSLSLAFLFPDTGGRLRWTADLLGSVAEIWRIPARQALAQEGVEQRILELSRFAGELVAATRAAYFESVAARESTSIARANLDLTLRSLAGVRRQVAEGAASKAEEALAESLSLSAELSLRRAERAGAEGTRRLGALLSVNLDLDSATLTDPMPVPAETGLEREALVSACLMARPDLRAAERAVAAAQARVALERKRRYPELDLGVSAERPEGGSPANFFAGPAAAVELPLFDQNQAQVSRAELELAERRKEREALVAEVGQEARAALDKAEITSRAAALARDELLPQAERSAALATRAFELGDTTVLTVLQAQRTLLEARRTALESLLEAVLARIELERVAGAPLGPVPGGAVRPAPPPSRR